VRVLMFVPFLLVYATAAFRIVSVARRRQLI